MRRRLLALLLGAALAPATAQAQNNRNCVGNGALQLQPIVVVPEATGFSYRLLVYNAAARTRSFSYHFPLPGLMPPPGAIYAFQIQQRQTIRIELGSTQQRASDEALRNALRITCHN